MKNYWMLADTELKTAVVIYVYFVDRNKNLWMILPRLL